MEFNVRSAPLGAAPVASDSPNGQAFLLATNACDGYRDAEARIALDPDLVGDAERAKAKGKEQGTRFATVADAERRLEGEEADLSATIHRARAAAHLDSPSVDPAIEVRAVSIRATFTSLSPSEKLQAVRAGSPEVLRAIYHSPDFGGQPAVDPKLKLAIEERLLAGADPDRAAALAVRIEDNRRARHAVERAKRYLGKAQSIRERLVTNKGN